MDIGALIRRLVLDGGAAGRLGPGLFTIGRAEDCDVVLSDPTASRCHAELRWEDGTWVLTDLRSRNGTFVNGRRAWRIVVEAGDEITLGGTRLSFAPVSRPAVTHAETHAVLEQLPGAAYVTGGART